MYTIASALIESGILDQNEVTQIWDSLALLDAAAEDAGLDGWDYSPAPAPPWLIAAATQAGLPVDQLEHMSREEVETAMELVCKTEQPTTAVSEAVQRANRTLTRRPPPPLQTRGDSRCRKYMPRQRQTCIRRAGHPGPCRST